MVAGPCLHGAAAVRVASSQRLGDGRRGLAAGVARPAQDELQRGSLRKGFKRRQSLRGRRQTKAGWLVSRSRGGVENIEEVVHDLGPCLTKFTIDRWRTIQHI